MSKYRIISAHQIPDSLEKIVALWRNNSSTLGFFPQGAFEEYIQKDQILVAVNNDHQFIGYLLYRISKNKISITHFCIDNDFRGCGASEELFTQLRLLTNNYDGIEVRCRRDYGLNNFWSKLGFKALSEKKGRGGNKNILTIWWYDYGHPDIFNINPDSTTLLPICIDANIFYDLADEIDPVAEESKSLLADWLNGKITIMLTPEIFNEVDRCEDQEKRKFERARITHFDVLPSIPEKYHAIETALKHLFHNNLSESDRSDIRQLAHAISSDVAFFITRDEKVLSKSEKLYEKYKISVMRPSELIINIDQLDQEYDYKPARLAGTNIKINRINDIDEKIFVEAFHRGNSGEKKSEFLRELRDLLSKPKDNKCLLILNKENVPLGLLCYKQSNVDELEIVLLRAKNGSLEKTIIHYLAFHAVNESCKEGNIFTRITDRHINSEMRVSLFDNGFIDDNKCLLKINIKGSLSSIELSNIIQNSTNKENSNRSEKIIDVLNKFETLENTKQWEIEKLVWPAKIKNSLVDNFIISIKPGWARELFDHKLANADLFGPKLELALNFESAYYRSVKNSGGLISPARILWYVSSDDKHHSLGIKACSRLEEIIIGKPKDLFKQFQRLGIYEWKNIYQLANRNINNNIMVLRFKHTEVFENTIDYTDTKKILDENNISSLMLSPTKINNAVFYTLYNKGVSVE